MEKDSDALADLLARARGGDDASRDELLRVVRAGVLRYLLARGVPGQDADDLAQETCLGLIRALPKWRDLGRPVWAFVFAIARNKVADRARVLAARREVPAGADTYVADTLAEQHPGPLQWAELGESTARVRGLLESLPATQRDVILLRVVVGLSALETGDALGLTAGSVRVLQHRAVTALRARLANGTEVHHGPVA